MSEQKQQMKYVPLRLRLRSSTGQTHWEREQTSHSNGRSQTTEPLMANIADISETQRHTRQIKGLVRLSNLLRANLGLDEVLQQIAASIAACTGFRLLVINLIDEKEDRIQSVAFAGHSKEHERILREARDSAETLHKVLRPDFRISQSYFVPHEHSMDVFTRSGETFVMGADVRNYQAGGWHPADALFVPLFSPCEQKMLGFLLLEDPEDGKRPTLEDIEVVELFANQAAIAIYNARLLQEREDERKALEESIALWREDIEGLQRGDLRVRIRATHPKLQPITDAGNEMLERFNTLVHDMQVVTQVVDKHTRNVQQTSEILVRDASQQEQQVYQISQVITEIAERMNNISQSAAILSKKAVDAVDVTEVAQGSVDRAIEGMSMVREATLQSARAMKSLSESGQEINETVMAITDLTSRMHLLALNAAIEATRAGEHGQGFAVVAKEMRTLAVHSAEAARKIGVYIRTFQQETSAVSQSVEQGTQHVVMQTELVIQTGVALDAVSVVTEQLVNLIQGVCATADNQSQGSQLVVNAVGEILHMTSDITRHMSEVQQSMLHLVDLTDSLRSRLSVLQLNEH